MTITLKTLAELPSGGAALLTDTLHVDRAGASSRLTLGAVAALASSDAPPRVQEFVITSNAPIIFAVQGDNARLMILDADVTSVSVVASVDGGSTWLGANSYKTHSGGNGTGFVNDNSNFAIDALYNKSSPMALLKFWGLLATAPAIFHVKRVYSSNEAIDVLGVIDTSIPITHLKVSFGSTAATTGRAILVCDGYQA
jgi:hypothetical protein